MECGHYFGTDESHNYAGYCRNFTGTILAHLAQ